MQDDSVYLAEGDKVRCLCALSDVAMPLTGHLTFNVQNVLAAIGAAWAYGLADAKIIEGLSSYS